MGFSSGGRLSAMFAAKFPERVRRLALLPTGDAGDACEALAQAYYGDCKAMALQGAWLLKLLWAPEVAWMRW